MRLAKFDEIKKNSKNNNNTKKNNRKPIDAFHVTVLTLNEKTKKQNAFILSAIWIFAARES